MTPAEASAQPLLAVVATYNIHRCIGFDRRHDADRVASVIGELDADVVGLQEVDARYHIEEGDDQAELGGLVVRVPAGLGVIEAVFLEIFRGPVGAGPIFAMLIAWRAVFLLAPLGVAAIVLAVLEYRSGATRAERRSSAGTS